MTLRDLLTLAIHQCQTFPERVDWPIVVGILSIGEDFTVLSGVEPDKDNRVFFIQAVPHSMLP